MPNYKNPGKIQFDAELLDGSGGGVFVEFPQDVQELFGVTGRVPVKAQFDGVPYRGSLVKMGSTCHCLGVLKEIRQKIQKGPGDRVQVILELDEEERTIELAADVLKLLKMNAAATATWEKLSFTNKREYHTWIESAKRSETRDNRVSQMIEKLAAGQKLNS